MRNSGLTAIGHLFGNKSRDEYNLALAQFCELAGCYLDRSLINKSVDLWKEMPAQVDLKSGCEFLETVVKTPESDTLEFQLYIERMVWDQLKYRYEDIICKNGFNMVSSFRLFAIFNRFCHIDALPLNIDSRSIRFIFYKLGLAHPESPRLAFQEFLLEVISRRDHFVCIKIIEMYDAFARDIVIEECLLVRFNGPSKTKGFQNDKRSSNAEFRRVAITTKHLIIKEKDTNVDQITALEPIRDYRNRFSIKNAQFCRSKRPSSIFSNFVGRLDHSITIFTEEAVIELIVDNKNGPELIYGLVDALKTVLQANFQNFDRLSMLKNKYKVPNFLGQTFSNEEDCRESESSTGSTYSDDSLNILIPRRSRSSDNFEKLQNKGKTLSNRTVASKNNEKSSFFSPATMDFRSLKCKHGKIFDTQN